MRFAVKRPLDRRLLIGRRRSRLTAYRVRYPPFPLPRLRFGARVCRRVSRWPSAREPLRWNIRATQWPDTSRFGPSAATGVCNWVTARGHDLRSSRTPDFERQPFQVEDITFGSASYRCRYIAAQYRPGIAVVRASRENFHTSSHPTFILPVIVLG